MELEVVKFLLLGYFGLSAVLTHFWLGWPIPFCVMGFVVLPLAVITYTVNKMFHKKIVISGVEISFD